MAVVISILLGALCFSVIDREALVSRHNVRVAAIDSASPLTVGNGEFGFTADVTGLQTLNATYASFPPLQTMSHWGWHKIPAALARVNPPSYHYEHVVVGDHAADYATNCTNTPEYNYLRENPHRINLARVFLRRLSVSGEKKPKPIVADDVTAINQTLHLWNGSLASTFTLDAELVSVETAVHPSLDVLAVRVCSALVAKASVGVGIAFPYAATGFSGGTDWRLPGRHTTAALLGRPEVLNHTLDNTTYFVHSAGGTLQPAVGGAPHDWTVTSSDKGAACLAVSFWFSLELQQHAAALPSAQQVFAASATGWAKQWQSGAALDLSGSTAEGAVELERRVVLSQYIMMSQEAGSNPPQETGLMTNSWYGKFHLEMRWHHQFHYTLWGRGELAQRADSFFDKVREPARDFTKRRQHYKGVRWPKMVAPPEYMTWVEFEDPTDASNPFFWYDGPSGAGPWILWQQPHPLSFAEMAYRAKPTAATLARYNQTVHDTADFMADFVLQAPPSSSGCYSLGAPMFTAEIESFEGRPAAEAKDGTFELVYWRFGLHIANQWRARQGLPKESRWTAAEDGICAPLPRPHNGTGPLVYYPYSNSSVDVPFAPGYAVQLFANALIPGGKFGVNDSVMAETIRQSLHALDINRLPWCSDPPLYAMAAARLGMVELATEFLLQPWNNDTGGTMRYLNSGHCQIKNFLPLYTPGNGALLSAVAMMVGGGWDGDDGRPAPGLPRDAGWKVQAEGFQKMF